MVFQSMLMIIGSRYLTFNTLFGNRLYLILGDMLGITAYLLFSVQEQAYTSTLAGAIIEIFFGIFMFIKYRRKNK
jgi:hypothetical protein